MTCSERSDRRNWIDRAPALKHNSLVPEYQFEGKLRNRADQLIRELVSVGIDASIVDGSARDYSVKVSICKTGTNIGNVVVYYRPKSDTFSMSTHELKDKSMVPTLERAWHGAPDSVQARSSGFEVYVDGSYSGGVTGYGVVILENGAVVDELYGAVDPAEVNGTYQVAGELAAVKETLKWCRAHSVDEVSIYYDYLGIEKWATGGWRAKQQLTQEYARFVRESGIKVHWHKVGGHTGNRWNDRADALARKGTGSASPAGGEDLLCELLERTDAWIEFLMVRGIEACFDQVYNEQFARVFIISEDKPVGTFDLYNTRKKKFSPYLHNFRDDDLKLRIETLWREFVASRAAS
ncbi:MAG TPA: RNase H family protein [Blastocatellia bacterium]|nr:RNase H family protein [Blastocatellia bacterium]